MDEFLESVRQRSLFQAWEPEVPQGEEEQDEYPEQIGSSGMVLKAPPNFVEESEVQREELEEEPIVTPFSQEPIVQESELVEEEVITEPTTEPTAEAEIITEEVQKPLGMATAEEAEQERREKALRGLLQKSDEQTFYESYVGKTANIIDISNLSPDVEDTQKMAWLGKLATFEATGNEEVLKADATKDQEYATKGKNLVNAFAEQRKAEGDLRDLTQSEEDQGTLTQIPKMFAKSFSQSINRSLAGVAGILGDVNDGSEGMRNLETFFRDNADTWDTIIQTDEDFNNSFVGQVSAGFGQLASTLATALVPGGAAAKIGSAAKYAGQGLATIMGVGAEYNDAYEAAKADGLSEEEARSAAQKYAPAGIVDVVSDLTVARFLKIPGFNKKAFNKLAVTIPGSIALEGGTEGLQRIYQNEILNKPWYQGAWDEALVGSVVGGSVNVVSKVSEKVSGSGQEAEVRARTAEAIKKLEDVGATKAAEALVKNIDPNATIVTPTTPEEAQIVQQTAIPPKPTYKPGTFEETVVRDQETGISQPTTEKLNTAVTNGARLSVGNKPVKIDVDGTIVDDTGNAITVDELNTTGIKITPSPLAPEVVSKFEEDLVNAKTNEDMGVLLVNSSLAAREDARWEPLATKAKLENFDRLAKGVSKELTPVGYFDSRKSKSKFKEKGRLNISKASRALETSIDENLKSGGQAVYYTKEEDGTETKYDVKRVDGDSIIVDGIGKVKSADVVKSKASYIRSVAGIPQQVKEGVTTVAPAVDEAVNIINDYDAGRLGSGPAVVERLGKAARDNGIEVTPQMTSQDIFGKLREIATPVIEARKAAPAPAVAQVTEAVTPTAAAPIVAFEGISEGHKAFSQGLDKLVQANSLTPDHVNILKEVFRDASPEILQKTSDIRARRDLSTAGRATTQFKDGQWIRSWITLRKDNVKDFKAAETEFWKSPSSEPAVVFLHEFGHVSYDAVLNDADRALVQEVYNKLKNEGKIAEYTAGGLVRGKKQAAYFAKNPQEFIAQSFAEYVVSEKVAASELKPILEKLYRKFREALNRVIGRSTTKEARMLAPILEKMRIGRGPEKVTTRTYRAEPTANELAGDKIDIETIDEGAAEAIPTTKEQVQSTAKRMLGGDLGNKYTQTLAASKWPPMLRSIIQIFGYGKRSPVTQQANELRSARIIEITGLGQTYINNFNKAIENAFKTTYDKLNAETKKLVDDASIQESDPITEEQTKSAQEAADVQKNATLIKLIEQRFTPEQIGDFNLARNPNQWLKDNLGDDLPKIRQKAYYAGQKVKNEALQRIAEQNIESARKRREEALTRLPENVRNAIQKMVINVEQLTLSQIKGGIIPPNSKLILEGRDGEKKTRINLAKSYIIENWQDYADKFKQTPEAMQRLTTWAENQYIKGQVEKLEQAVYEQTGQTITKEQAKKAVLGQMNADNVNIENIVRAFIDGAVASPQTAFQDVLVKRLGLDQAVAESSFAEAVKNALTEINSATTTYAQITANISEAIANYEMFTYIRENAGPDGEGWLVDAKEIDELGPDALRNYTPVEDLDTRIPGFKNAFSGLWVPNEFVKEMENTYKIFGAQIGGVVQGMLILNNLSMAAQTSLNPIRGPIRNFFGNPFLFMASGKYQFNELADAWTAAKAAFLQRGEGYALEVLEDMYKYGMIEDNPNIGLAREQMKIARDNVTQKNALARGLNIGTVKKVGDIAAKWYTAPDNLWRYTMWSINQKTLKEAYPQGLPERLGGFEAGTDQYNDVIKREAANWTKNEIPSFSRMSALGRAWRKPGVAAVVAPFIGFTSEILRISHANLYLAFENIKNGNKENNSALRNDGYKRLAGTAFAYGSTYAIAAWFKSMFDIDDEEEEAARATLPPWDKNANLIWWRDSKTGKLNYFNTSFLNPLSIISDPFNVYKSALREDTEGGPKAYAKAVGGSLMKLFEGYIDPQIATKAVFEATTNSIDGRQVYNPQDSWWDITKDISGHITNSIQPGILKQGWALGKALVGVENKEGVVAEKGPALLNFFFARSSEINPEVAFKYKTFEMNQKLRDSARILTSQIKRKGGISDLEIEDAYRRANDAYGDVISEAIRLYQGQLKLGTDPKELDALMDGANLSKDVQRQIKNGLIKPYGLSKTTARVIAPERVKIIKGLQDAQEVRVANDKNVLNAPVGYPIEKPSAEGEDFI
jgi:hypothetical protein